MENGEWKMKNEKLEHSFNHLQSSTPFRPAQGTTHHPSSIIHHP
jgi:hypothetical protein